VRPVIYPPADGAIVAFSGGKDSLVVLDLAVKHFPRVEAFHMYFLPDLEYNRIVVDYAERRFGVKVRMYPHWYLSRLLNCGTCCDAVPTLRDASIQSTITHARAETGLWWCGVGYRTQESLLQRRWLSRKGWDGPCHVDGRWAPLRDWKKRELIAHLKRERIVIPGLSAGQGMRPSGIDLSLNNLTVFKRQWPRDYERIVAAFPWAAIRPEEKDALDARRKAWSVAHRAGAKP
jgi:phosphoadenosine phosphosulfate reductase